ncbi:MAG: hypothetical protein ACFCBW_19890 [Candidatus Competibacterales bacterium]
MSTAVRLFLWSMLITLVAGPALAWEYQVVRRGAITYAEGLPPRDLTYPPQGEPAVEIGADQQPMGELITLEQLRENIQETPHLIIIPGRESANVNAVRIRREPDTVGGFR